MYADLRHSILHPRLAAHKIRRSRQHSRQPRSTQKSGCIDGASDVITESLRHPSRIKNQFVIFKVKDQNVELPQEIDAKDAIYSLAQTL
jgi:hypothetical protein